MPDTTLTAVTAAFKFIWAPLTLIAGWLWMRVRDIDQRLQQVPDRAEVRERLQDALKPIEQSVAETKSAVNFLVQLHIKKETDGRPST